MLLASSRERLPILLKGVVASVAQRVSEKLPGLRPVDKVLLLQRLPIFEQASGEELVDLGARAREISFTAGSFLFEELGGPGLYMVVSGELFVESQGGAAFVAMAGDAIGVYEPLLGASQGSTGRATRDGTALYLDREELLEVLADRHELLRGLFSALLRMGRFRAGVGGRSLAKDSRDVGGVDEGDDADGGINETFPG